MKGEDLLRKFTQSLHHCDLLSNLTSHTLLNQMPVEFPSNWLTFTPSFNNTNNTTFSMYPFYDASKMGNRNSMMPAKLFEANPHDVQPVYYEGSKSVPIPAEVIQNLRAFLLSLPGASERGLGWQQ